MLYLSALIGLIFTVFGLLQWNDSDAFIWMFLYLGVGICWFWNIRDKPPRWLSVPLLVFTLGWSMWLVPDLLHWLQMGAPSITSSMKAEAPHIELVREFGGLMLCWLSLIPLVMKGKRSHGKGNYA